MCFTSSLLRRQVRVLPRVSLALWLAVFVLSLREGVGIWGGDEGGLHLRPYLHENTASRPISKVKHGRDSLVLSWETRWESGLLQFSYCRSHVRCSPLVAGRSCRAEPVGRHQTACTHKVASPGPRAAPCLAGEPTRGPPSPRYVRPKST